ncbi:MAG: TlpA family protein disulfide reductase, partial [Actinomycetota bacterium]
SPLSSADHLGDVVVVNAWASWCAPCREELPLLTQAHESFLDEGVIFLGLNVLDDPIGAAGLLASSPYPSIFDRDGALLATVPGVPPRSIPSTVVIDRQGRLAARIIGPVQPGQLEPLLAEIAAEA